MGAPEMSRRAGQDETTRPYVTPPRHQPLAPLLPGSMPGCTEYLQERPQHPEVETPTPARCRGAPQLTSSNGQRQP